MQIRVANRQDEPIIRTIVNQAYAESAVAEVDLKERDADLNNIESNYFWHDGIFVVAEEDGQIVGLAGARRGDTEQDLELVRMVVSGAKRRRGIARKLLETICFFGSNSEYKQLVFVPKKHGTTATNPVLGFTASGANWTLPLGSVGVSCQTR